MTPTKRSRTQDQKDLGTSKKPKNTCDSGNSDNKVIEKKTDDSQPKKKRSDSESSDEESEYEDCWKNGKESSDQDFFFNKRAVNLRGTDPDHNWPLCCVHMAAPEEFLEDMLGSLDEKCTSQACQPDYINEIYVVESYGRTIIPLCEDCCTGMDDLGYVIDFPRDLLGYDESDSESESD